MNSIVDPQRAAILQLSSPFNQLLNSDASRQFARNIENELFLTFNDDAFSLVISSPNTQSGKTLVALMTSLYPSLHSPYEHGANSKTLVIDASQHFNITRALGLEPDRERNLCSLTAVDDVSVGIRTTGFAKVDLCQVFSPSSAGQLLPTQQLKSLQQEHSGSYRRIIVDTMAASVNSDYLALARVFSHVLLVTQHRITRRQQLQHQLDNLTNTGCQVIGALMNQRQYSIPAYLC